MVAMILTGDCRQQLRTLPAKSVHACVTSPPYFGLRDYQHPDQIGTELHPDAFVAELVEVFREVRRVLRDDGSLWLNLGDSYAGGGSGARDPERWPKQSRNDHLVVHTKKHTGLKFKNLIGIPWRVALALQADGWILREEIIWSKTNPMSESVVDRCTRSHEYLFHFTKRPKYYHDKTAMEEPVAASTAKRMAQNIADQAGSVRQPGRGGRPMKAAGNGKTRNRRSVWSISTARFKGAHFATFPPALIEPCIRASSPPGGVVLDPFGGAGTTGLVCNAAGRDSFLIELHPDNVALMVERIGAAVLI